MYIPIVRLANTSYFYYHQWVKYVFLQVVTRTCVRESWKKLSTVKIRLPKSLKSKDFRIIWIKKRNYLRRPYSNLGTLFIVSGVRTRGAPTTLFVTYLYELQTLWWAHTNMWWKEELRQPISLPGSNPLPTYSLSTSWGCFNLELTYDPCLESRSSTHILSLD